MRPQSIGTVLFFFHRSGRSAPRAVVLPVAEKPFLEPSLRAAFVLSPSRAWWPRASLTKIPTLSRLSTRGLRAKDQMAERYVKGMTFNNIDAMPPWFTRAVPCMAAIDSCFWNRLAHVPPQVREPIGTNQGTWVRSIVSISPISAEEINGFSSRTTASNSGGI